MKIVVNDFVAGAQSAAGIAVIIDVFRAFSLAAYAFDAGAAAIFPVADLEQARQLKHTHPERLLLGERYAQPLTGFDGGNSPAQLRRWSLLDREIIHTTHSGTQGLVNALYADEVLTGALVNAGAIVRYIQHRRPAQVTLVRMGYAACERCDEDDLCAELIRARLCDEEYPVHDIQARLRTVPAAAKFFDSQSQSFAPQADFDLCTAVDRFDFVLRLDRGCQPFRLQKVNVPS